MKHKLKNIVWISLIFFLATFTIFSINSNIKATNEIDILTKKSIFDIIDNIEDIVITCISTDGNKHISEENKMDVTVLYLIKNKEKYKEYIIPSDFENSDEKICIGKVESKVFIDLSKEIFEKIEYNVNEYKNFKDEFINLNFEPCSYSIFDKKDIVCLNRSKTGYRILIKYKRELNNVQNKVYIQYDFDLNLKIQDITILSSIVD